MSKLKDLAEKQEKLKKEIYDNAKDALGEAFAELFETHPEIARIKWRQYTPYFNDGDPCTFGVEDFYFQTTKAAEAEATAGEAEDSDEVNYDEDAGWVDTYSYSSKSKTDSKKRAVQDLRAICSEEVMLAAFGDHVRIVASRDGFDVEEYSHD